MVVVNSLKQSTSKVLFVWFLVVVVDDDDTGNFYWRNKGSG